uniref:Uncharacterized protein n=1 Tax=Guillardia theta TaxID=55529 RepID=A0A7S4JDJ9_GUITH|mmetsp:Transcript_15236/g.51340  ORF Transcript_15236/g.51340 Transcript_15236/m.51340 type:complete len:127 (+) Transcript_15236:2-382(+)
MYRAPGEDASMRFILGCALVAAASAFAPTPSPGLRQTPKNALSGMSMVCESRKTFKRTFGFPATDGAGCIKDDDTAKQARRRADGWMYRAPGTNEFKAGATKYDRADAMTKAAPLDVRRYHSNKSS